MPTATSLKPSSVFRSSFHDVTLLAAPLLTPADTAAIPRGDDGVPARQDGQTARTVRVLRFGFAKRESTPFWRFDPFTECRGRPFLETSSHLLHHLFPCLSWMLHYDLRRQLKNDVLAGLSVGFMLIPQGMAYARVAGLPSVYGLYTGCVPCIIYGIFGTSRQLAVGPTAMVSLLVGESVRKFADPESTDPSEVQRYIGLAILLAVMAGVVQLVGGWVKLGFLVRFLSQAVVSGFSSGAAIIIGLTQMRYLLGYRYPRSDKIHVMMRDIVVAWRMIDVSSLLMGLVALAFLLLMKHFGKKYKKLRLLRTLGPILAVCGGVVFIYLTGNPWQIRVVDSIPQGFPHLFFDLPLSQWDDFVVPSLVIGGAAYLETIGVAKTLAAKNGYSVDANQELVCLGLCNVLGSFFSAYPTAGSFSRSAVSSESGAKSGLAGMVSGVLILFALVYATPLFELLPMPVLAAIVLSSVAGLVDVHEARYLLEVDPKDFLVWCLAFAGTMFCGIRVGVLVSVLISLWFVIDESAKPNCQLLGRLPGTTVYRNVDQYPDAKTTPGVVAIRLPSHLYFANINSVQETLVRLVDTSASKPRGASPEQPAVQYVVLDMTAVNAIDSAACQALTAMRGEYESLGIHLTIVNPNQSVMQVLERAALPDLIGRHRFFVRVYDAVHVCKAEMAHRNNDDVTTPSPGVSVTPELTPSVLPRGASTWPLHADNGTRRGSGGSRFGLDTAISIRTDVDEDPDAQSGWDFPRSHDSVVDVESLMRTERASIVEEMVGDRRDPPYPPLPSPPSTRGAGGAGGAGGRGKEGAEEGENGSWNLANRRNFATNPVQIPPKVVGMIRSRNGSNSNIVGADRQSPLSSDLSRSAPEAMHFDYVLFEEVEGDVLAKVPRANFCRTCRGVREQEDGTMPIVDSKHVVVEKCTCIDGGD